MSDDEDYVYSEEDEQEEYAYSDDEKDSKMDQDGTDTEFEIPDSSYKIKDYQDIIPMLQHMTQEVSSLLGVDDDISQVLLHKYRWNKERLVEEFFSDSDKALESAGLVVTKAIGNGDTFRENFCRICLSQCDPNRLYSLSCNHKFCVECYQGYLVSMIGDGPICITATCPEHQCRQRILSGTVKTLCSPEIHAKYLMYFSRNFVDTSTTMRWCPSPGCEKVAVGSGVTSVRCSCSESFCFRCGGEAHDPASCKQLELWLEKCQSESETANWILANTKKCPKCSARIEKNQGI